VAFTFEPFGDRVLVEFEDISAKYKNLIEMPDNRRESTRVSRVLRVGSGVKNPKIVPGARVVTAPASARRSPRGIQPMRLQVSRVHR
jgi:co-chaperonin GroES (HSP10)